MLSVHLYRGLVPSHSVRHVPLSSTSVCVQPVDISVCARVCARVCACVFVFVCVCVYIFIHMRLCIWSCLNARLRITFVCLKDSLPSVDLGEHGWRRTYKNESALFLPPYTRGCGRAGKKTNKICIFSKFFRLERMC